MREIGVRQLKESLSETLRAVARGEQIRVTRRGVPLADIVPATAAPRHARLLALVAEGRLTAPSRRKPPQPPRLVRSARNAARIVLADRDAER
jgi:prevent-host-death family protein